MAAGRTEVQRNNPGVPPNHPPCLEPTERPWLLLLGSSWTVGANRGGRPLAGLATATDV